MCGVGRVGSTAAAANFMLRLLKRWLGWDSNSGPFDFSELRFGARQNPSPPRPQPHAANAGYVAQRGARAPATGSPQAAQPRQSPPREEAEEESVAMDLLDNPQLTLDRPTDDGFDPYNTGAFNRSASWNALVATRRIEEVGSAFP
jgi:hypothetical protein